MAHTKVTKTGTQNTGTANTFSYSGSFDVFKATEVEVELDNVKLTYTASTINESASPREYTVDATAKTVHVGGADLAGTNSVVIQPVTDMGAPTPRATYSPGSSITSDDLNNNQLQLMRKAMEYDQQKLSNRGGTMTGNLHLGKDIDLSYEGSTDNAYETTLTVTDPTADRTVTLPNATGTVPLLAVHSDTTITATPAELNYSDGVTSNIQTQLDAKQPLDAQLTELATMAEATAESIADLSSTEVQILDGATLSTTELNYVDGVTSGIQSQLDGKQASGSYQTADADLTDLSSCQAGAAAKLALLTADEVEKIDGLTATTAELNKLDGVTASATDLNIVSGMTKQTTISDTDSSYPTSGAVVDYFASAIQPFGGIEVIADEDNFPTSQPASGVVISITDAAGVVFNGSGVSTTARTAGNGSDNVTINGAPATLYGETLASGVGLQVTSTGSSNTYNFHRILATPADVKQLSDDINDFNSRYRTATNRTADGDSSNDEGDLFFDQTTNKMYVHDGSTWGQVTSTGEFKYLVLCNAGTTNAATYNSSDVSYDLKETSTSGNAASVTSAAQLIVSVNGVIQKPNTGTNTSGLDGFVMTDADTIKFTAGPPANAEVFVVQIGSATQVSVPANDSVTAAKLDLSIVQGDLIYGSGTDTWARLAKGTAGKVLKMNSGATAPEWADDTGTPEGTAIKSTGESGGTKFLREDGDGTCSWQTVATTPTDITVADESSDTTCFPLFVTAATGDLAPKSGSNLTFNSNTGALGATSFTGDGSALTGISTPGSFRNLIINGAMQIAQRNTSSTSHGLTTVDRISTYETNTDAGTKTWSQADITSGGAYDVGFRKAFKIATSQAGNTSNAAAYMSAYATKLEAQDIANSGWEYTDPNSKITLSFWIKASTADNFQLQLVTDDGTKKKYNTTVAATTSWTKITKTIPGHADLTFNNDNGKGLTVQLIVATGSDMAGTVTQDAWGANTVAAVNANQINTWLAAGAGTIETTGWQLEVGATATDFEHRSYDDELSRSQRYFQVFHKKIGVVMRVHSSTQALTHIPLIKPMRAVPTYTISPSSANYDLLYGGSVLANQSSGWPFSAGGARLGGFELMITRSSGTFSSLDTVLHANLQHGYGPTDFEYWASASAEL